jgi:hypothetical protein
MVMLEITLFSPGSRSTILALPRRAATQLIELCQVECSPRVSFETAETKTKER